MTHYELLGLRPEATDAEVIEAIRTARASWERRSAAAADPPAAARAGAAVARLAEAERDLGDPAARRAYDEATLPAEVLRRIRAAGATDPGDEAGQQARRDAEEAIRAEMERRREARRHQEERDRDLRETVGAAPEDDPGAPGPSGEGANLPDPDEPGPAPLSARAGRAPRPARGDRMGRAPEIDRKSVALLALATAAGIGIALIPVAVVTSSRGTEASGEPTASPRALPLPDVTGTPASLPAAAEPKDGATVAVAADPIDLATPAIAADASAAELDPASELAAARAATGQAPAEPVAEPAAAAPPGEPAATPEAVQALLRQAFAAYGGGRYHESLARYDEALARRPDDPIARVGRALTLLALGRPRDAETECRAALQVQPAFPEAHFNLGVALHRQRRDAEAVAAFRRFADLAPDDPAAPQARGFIARYNLARQRATMTRSASR